LQSLAFMRCRAVDVVRWSSACEKAGKIAATLALRGGGHHRGEERDIESTGRGTHP
jgi:hypothetical protein